MSLSAASSSTRCRPVFNAFAITASWPTATAPPNSLSAVNYWLPPPLCFYPSSPTAATSWPHSPASTFVCVRNVVKAFSAAFLSPAQLRPVWTRHDADRSQFVGTLALLCRQPTLPLCLSLLHRRGTDFFTDFPVLHPASFHLLPTFTYLPTPRPCPRLSIPMPRISL